MLHQMSLLGQATAYTTFRSEDGYVDTRGEPVRWHPTGVEVCIGTSPDEYDGRKSRYILRGTRACVHGISPDTLLSAFPAGKRTLDSTEANGTTCSGFVKWAYRNDWTSPSPLISLH
jgi:hypothetical protein